MPNSAAQRATMVAAQLRPNDVTDARVRDAMLTIPRERFVPQASAAVAYAEGCVPLGGGRALLDPRSLGKLLQLAAIRPDDVALDIGCGTGYSTAVLSLIAAKVIAVEEDASLAASAADNLRDLGVSNAGVICAPLFGGSPDEGPFDVIFLNGAIQVEPTALLAQLKDGGRLVAIACGNGTGQARLYLNHEGAIGERDTFNAHVPVLPGFEKPPRFVF